MIHPDDNIDFVSPCGTRKATVRGGFLLPLLSSLAGPLLGALFGNKGEGAVHHKGQYHNVRGQKKGGALLDHVAPYMVPSAPITQGQGTSFGAAQMGQGVFPGGVFPGGTQQGGATPPYLYQGGPIQYDQVTTMQGSGRRGRRGGARQKKAPLIDLVNHLITPQGVQQGGYAVDQYHSGRMSGFSPGMASQQAMFPVNHA